MQKTIFELNVFKKQFTKALDSLVEGVSLIAKDEVAELLSQFSEYVPECDIRLRKCADLLSKGLRDEALGYECDDPPLLDLVKLLDLSSRPEWSRWLVALRAAEFPEPVMPNVKIAVELEKAKIELAKLKPLLDKWRRGNLANSPLPTRIVTLRQLRQEDPNNEAWYECLKVHEKQRAMQIEVDVKKAFATQDEQWLERLSEEFKVDWLESPPQRVRHAVKNALRTIRVTRINRDVEQIAGDLSSAYEARDLDATRTIRDQWNRLALEKGSFNVDDPHLIKAAPILEWVGRHDRLESLFMEIGQSLDSRPRTRRTQREWVRNLSRMRDELEDIAEKLQDQIDLEPIERLRSRVARVEEEHQREQHGRRRLLYLTVVAATVVIIGSVATVISLVRHNDRVRDAVAQVDELLRRIELGELAPDNIPEMLWLKSLAEDPRVSTRMGLLDAATTQERDRIRQLDEATDTLEKMLESLREKTSITSFALWPDPFTAATKTLALMKSPGVTKTEDERAKIAKFEGLLQNAVRRFQRDDDEEFSKKLQDIQKRLTLTNEQIEGTPQESIEFLNAIEKEVVALRTIAAEHGAPGADGSFSAFLKVSPSLARRLNVDGDIQKAIFDVRKNVDEYLLFTDSEQDLSKFLGDWTRYAETLESVATKFPKRAVARDYTEAAKDVSIWKAVNEWNRYVGKMKPLANLTSDRAQEVANEFDKLRNEAGQLTFVAKFIDQLEPSVKVFVERDVTGLKKSLEEWIEGEWLGELQWSMSHKESLQVYYGLKEPVKDSMNFKYQSVMKVDGQPWATAKSIQIGEDFVGSLSPQKKLATELNTHCISILGNKIEGFSLDLMLVDAIERTLMTKQIEPCLKMLTLRKLLLAGRKVAPSFKIAKVNEFIAQIDDDNGGVPNVSVEDLGTFLNPNCQEIPAYLKTKKIAEKLLTQMETVLEQLKLNLVKMRDRFDKPDAATFVCVGRLGRATNGKISLVSLPSVSMTPNAKLLVIGPQGESTDIGTCDLDGRAKINIKTSLVAGVPVFVIQPKIIK